VLKKEILNEEASFNNLSKEPLSSGTILESINLHGEEDPKDFNPYADRYSQPSDKSIGNLIDLVLQVNGV